VTEVYGVECEIVYRGSRPHVILGGAVDDYVSSDEE
jgi:hypothetical protein